MSESFYVGESIFSEAVAVINKCDVIMSGEKTDLHRHIQLKGHSPWLFTDCAITQYNDELLAQHGSGVEINKINKV